MRNQKTMMSICIVVAAALLAWAPAQGATKGALTPQDYTEIQELNAQYATYFDSDEREGMAWAGLFTPDGEFITGDRKAVGTKALADFVNEVHKGPGKNLHLWIGNLVVKPTPEGVETSQYVMVLMAGSPPTIRTTAVHQALLVKTGDGWRIKRRTVLHDQVS